MAKCQVQPARPRDSLEVQQTAEIGGHDLGSFRGDDLLHPVGTDLDRQLRKFEAEVPTEAATFLTSFGPHGFQPLDALESAPGVDVRCAVAQTVTGRVEADPPLERPSPTVGVILFEKPAELVDLRGRGLRGVVAQVNRAAR